MTTLNRLVISWAGPSVKGAAVTVLHFSASDNAAPPVAAVKSAFDTAKGIFPSGVTLTFPSTGDQINDTTGALTGVWAATGGQVVGTGAGGGAPAGVGAVLGWQTGGIVNGKKGPRKLRGRTFLVPLDKSVYETDGTIDPNIMTVMNTLASNLRAAGPLAIWHRPTTQGGTDGNSYGVISHKIRDHVAFLSSRRD